MQNIFLVALPLAAVWYFTQSKKKSSKKKSSSGTAGTCDPNTPWRFGIRPLCEGTECVGVSRDPSYQLETEEEAQAYLGLMTDALLAVFGTDNPQGPISPAQARMFLDAVLTGLFPQCDWSALAGSAPFGDQTFQGAAAAMIPEFLPQVG